MKKILLVLAVLTSLVFAANHGKDTNATMGKDGAKKEMKKDMNGTKMKKDGNTTKKM